MEIPRHQGIAGGRRELLMDTTTLKELPETFDDIYAEVQDDDTLDEDLKAAILSALEEAGDNINWILGALKEN